mmetsp:Transcript_10374/g.29170  ORF Transcript_10374/g.29170 Transcript_10374/m.29170 type:complete len:230 (-) Transcript_10374:164-853(-)
MTPDIVDHKLLAVDDLDVGLVAVGLIIQTLVDVGIHLTTSLEVGDGLLGVGVAIVGGGRLDGPNVFLQQCLVVTDALNKDDTLGPNAGIRQTFQDVLPAGVLAVGGIEDGDATSILLDVLDGIVQGGIARHGPLGQCLGVAVVIEVGRLRGTAQLAAVVAHVENLRGDGMEEAEEAAYALPHVRLSGGGQTDHYEHELVRVAPRATTDVEGGGILALGNDVRRWVFQTE